MTSIEEAILPMNYFFYIFGFQLIYFVSNESAVLIFMKRDVLDNFYGTNRVLGQKRNTKMDGFLIKHRKKTFNEMQTHLRREKVQLSVSTS